jgi:phosphoribosylformylglycinamidine synthase
METLQFSAVSVIEEVRRCQTPDVKAPRDRVYVLGVTRNEMGASEYYDRLGFTGCNVPRVDPEAFAPLYRALHRSVLEERVESVHGVYRGGLGVHLAMTAMAGGLGLRVDLGALVCEEGLRTDGRLFSESAGRFVVTTTPENAPRFEALMKGLPWACVGEVTDDGRLTIAGPDGAERLSLSVEEMKAAWKEPFEGKR